MDAAGRQAERAAWVEVLDGEEQLPRRPADDHADLGDPVGRADRIERDVVERHLALERGAETARQGRDLGAHRGSEVAVRGREGTLVHAGDRSVARTLG